jgi:hypothetical protein
MDFHHRDSTTKSFSLGWGVTNVGRQRLIQEIAKCDLYCAVCHRILEYALDPETLKEELVVR